MITLTITLEGLISAMSVLVLVVVWFARLEGRISQEKELRNALEKVVDELQKKVDTIDSKIVDKLSVIEKSLAKIEGRLSITLENS